MIGSRKRKQAALDDTSLNHHTVSSTNAGSIKAFARISKAVEVDSASKKRKMVHQREATPPVISVTKPTPAKADNKRKRSLDSVAEESEEEDDSGAKKAGAGMFKQIARKDQSKTPRNKRLKNALPPSPAETPSKNAAALFGKLQLDSSAIPFPLGERPAGYDTPPDTPEAEKHAIDLTLPSELQELVSLHSAFLSALGLYYAHNGTSTAVEVHMLLPQITKSWKKRAVELDDLRKILAITPARNAEFILQDCGKAGIRLTRPQPRGRALKRAASYLDEDDLNARFEEALQQRWLKWQSIVETHDRSASAFLAQIPLAEIIRHESVDKAAPIFSRGQERLAELRAGQAAASAEHGKPATAVAPEQKKAEAVQSRGTSLLDRILAKQAITSSMPAGPTRSQLERKSALHRIEDVARVLDLLASGKPRCSFSMQAIIQQLQQSLRNPISKEEIERVLGLMAEEVTPAFVSIVQSGSVKGVVVCRNGRVGVDELRARVQRAQG